MSEKNGRHCTGIIVYRFNESLKQYEIVLVQSEKFRHHPTDQFLWTIPGGRIEESDGVGLEQQIINCAVREVGEELGISIQDVKYYPLLNSQRTGAEIGYKEPEMQFYFYECTARPVSEEFRLGSEIAQAQWFPIQSLPELMTEDIRIMLADIAAHTEIYFQK